jgi:signal peptidase II
VRVLFVTVFIVIADQVTKLLVKGLSLPSLGIHWEGMPYGSSIPVFGDILRWTYIENSGMAFGIDPGGGKIFFSAVSLIAGIAILIYLYRMRSESLILRLPLAMILGGAVGNLIDRMLYGVFFDGGALFTGRVVDFIDVDFFDVNVLGVHFSRWPVFNIADASVTTGVILLLLFSHRVLKEKEPISVSGVHTDGSVPFTQTSGDMATAQDGNTTDQHTPQ